MVLENVAAEVKKKVKSAIKAKLIELGVYCDNELPDYIMILVGNKKTKDQMEEDLSLFLGHNTEKFISWLFSVLQRLNAASFLQTPKSTKQKEKKKEEKEKEKESPEEETTKVVEEKKHKKKKDKSEKKKQKKEKKKKKKEDKEKKSHKKESKSKSPSAKSEAAASAAAGADDVSEPLDEPVPSTSKDAIAKQLDDVLKEMKKELDMDDSSEKSDEGERGDMEDSKLSPQEPLTSMAVKQELDIPDDVVNLRPDAEDLALGLEDEILLKNPKPKEREVITHESSVSGSSLNQPLTSLEIKVANPSASVQEPASHPSDEEKVSSTSSRDRQGLDALQPGASPPPKRVINLREESSFTQRGIYGASHGAEGLSRVVSSAIASAVKSVAVTVPNSTGGAETKTAKKLEARVRPLSRIATEDDVDTVEPPPPAPRVVSKVGAILKRSHPSDDSGGSDEPAAKRISVIASKVEVAPRPRRTGASQANTALILRAVADAHKSVSRTTKRTKDDAREDMSSSNRKELFTKSFQERQAHRLSGQKETTTKKFAITVPNSFLKENIGVQIGTKRGEPYLKGAEMEQDLPGDDASLPMDTVELPPGAEADKIIPMEMDDPSGSTRFIVTLDGLGNEVTAQPDLRSRLPRRSVRTPSVDEEEFIEEVEVWEEEVEEMEGITPTGLPTQVPRGSTPAAGYATKWKSKIDVSNLVEKKEERCRFWPACKEGSSCAYIHPSKSCSSFPACRFGDKCIYIHPTCKFDAFCAKPNCPFTHTTPRNAAYTGPAALLTKAKVPPPKSKVKCRYYPKCVDMNCPYMHPKQICRYGKACQTPSCMFVHPEVTTGALLKWTAPRATPSASPSAITAPTTKSLVPIGKDKVTLASSV